jgi:uncharacterized protein
MTTPESPESSDLCTGCGMCCSGVIYDRLPLDYEEVGPAIALGLPVEDVGGGPTLKYPCPRLDGAKCTIYADRPSGCRTFRCVTLQELDRGEIALDGALERVRDAQERWRGLGDELDGETIPQLRWRRAELAEAGTALPPGKLRDALNHLDEMLDRHFRKPDQRHRNHYAALEGRPLD